MNTPFATLKSQNLPVDGKRNLFESEAMIFCNLDLLGMSGICGNMAETVAETCGRNIQGIHWTPHANTSAEAEASADT